MHSFLHAEDGKRNKAAGLCLWISLIFQGGVLSPFRVSVSYLRISKQTPEPDWQRASWSCTLKSTFLRPHLGAGVNSRTICPYRGRADGN